MKAFFIFLITIISIFFLVIVFFAVKDRKLIKTLIFNAFIGVCFLAIIDLTGKFTGLYIPVNLYSVGGCSVFGIPAVCGFLLLQIIVL